MAIFVTEIRATAVRISKAQSIQSHASRLSGHEATAVNFIASRHVDIAAGPRRRRWRFSRGRALPSASPPGRLLPPTWLSRTFAGLAF